MNLETRSDRLEVYSYATRALDLADRRVFHMTDHGPGHLERSVYYAELLSIICGLTDEEKRLLLAGCYLHDIGLVQGRVDHNEHGVEIVRDAQTRKLLNFDKAFLNYLVEIIRHHSGVIDSEIARKLRENEFGSLRLHLVIELLRIADALDMDYRRSVDFDDPVIRQLLKLPEYEESILHHLGLQCVAGVRLYLHHIPAIEIFVKADPMYAALHVGRLQREILATSLSFPIMVVPVHEKEKEMANHNLIQSGKVKRALIFAYCNPMGVINAGITAAALRRQGTEFRVICDWDKTSDMVEFWGSDRIDNEMNDYNPDAVLFVGMPFAHEMRDESLKKLTAVKDKGCYVFYGTYFPTSYIEITKIAALGARVGIGDARMAFFGIAVTEREVEWMKISDILDRSPLMYEPSSESRILEEAAKGFEYCMIKTEDEPVEWSVEKLWQSVAEESCERYVEYSEKAQEWISKQKVPNVTAGIPVLRIDGVENMKVRGRHLYSILDSLIEEKGFYFGSCYAPRYPYVIAIRKYDEMYRVLFQTYSHCTVYPPLYYFLPDDIEDTDLIGPKKAFWMNFKREEEVKFMVDQTIKKAKKYYKKNPIK